MTKAKWIRVEYSINDISGVKGFEGSIHSGGRLYEIFEHLGLQRHHIITFKVDDQLQSPEEIDKVFEWYVKKEKEKDEDEKREKA